MNASPKSKRKNTSRAAECEGKKRFPDLKSARRFLKDKDRDDMGAYFCHHCKRAHIGH